MTVKGVPRRRSATSASATPLADADGGNLWKCTDLTGGDTSPGSGSTAERTGGKGEGSTEAGSRRPECDRAGEPRSRRPGSGKKVGRVAHSAKSR